MIRLSYYLLEENTSTDAQSSREAKEKPSDLEVFFNTVQKKQDSFTKPQDHKHLAQYFKLLPLEILDKYIQLLSGKGYSSCDRSHPDEVRKALLIEYINSQTKIIDRNDDVFQQVWTKYKKNPTSGTTKNERRFLQAYLFIHGHFPTDKNIFDECDSIIGNGTKAAYGKYKQSLKGSDDNNSPSVIANTTPTTLSENTTYQETIDTNGFDPSSFDQTNKDSIRAFQTWFNMNVLSSTPLKALKVDSTFGSQTRLAVKRCWEKNQPIGGYEQTPLFADANATDKLFQEVFGSGPGYQLITKLTSSGSTPTALARILALAKHEGYLKFGRKNMDPSQKGYSLGTFQLHTPGDLNNAQRNYNKLLNVGISIAQANGIDTSNLTLADRDLLSRVGHVQDKSTIKGVNLRKPLADDTLNKKQLAELISDQIQVGRDQIGVHVANRTLPPSKLSPTVNDSIREGSFVYNYIA